MLKHGVHCALPQIRYFLARFVLALIRPQMPILQGGKHRSVVMIQSSTMSVALKFELKRQSDVEQFRSVVKTLRSERALERALSCCPLD
eukprot:830159-Prymnesium_polylepis.1